MILVSGTVSMHFRKTVIRSGLYFWKIGIKSGRHFGKVGIRNKYVFEASMACPHPKFGQVASPQGLDICSPPTGLIYAVLKETFSIT